MPDPARNSSMDMNPDKKKKEFERKPSYYDNPASGSRYGDIYENRPDKQGRYLKKEREHILAGGRDRMQADEMVYRPDQFQQDKDAYNLPGYEDHKGYFQGQRDEYGQLSGQSRAQGQQWRQQQQALAQGLMGQAGQYGANAQGWQGNLGGLYGAMGAQAQGAYGQQQSALAQGLQQRAQQNQLGSMLMDQARGNGPSVAQLQLQQGLQQSSANALGNVAGMRDVSPAMRARMAADSQAGMAQQTNQAASQLRAQEMLAARGMLDQHLAGVRGQDLSTAQMMGQQGMGLQGMQSSLGQNLFGQNLQAQQQAQALGAGLMNQGRAQDMSQQQMDLGMQQWGAEQALGVDKTQMAGNMASEEARQRAWEAHQQMIASQYNSIYGSGPFQPSRGGSSGPSMGQTIVGGLLQAGGAIGAAAVASDRRQKKNIKELSPGQMDKFIQGLKGYQYEYKKPDLPGADKGKFSGVMAQDLQKTELGKRAVQTMKHTEFKAGKNGEFKPGKQIEYLAIDMRQALGAALAGLGRLGQRIEALEEKKVK